MEHSTDQSELGQIGRWLMDFPVAMLTTVDETTGSLRSRPMALAGGEFQGELFFFTREDTTKVSEIRAEQQVNVALADPAAGRYLSLTGNASLVTDPGELESHWNDNMLVWFPEGLQQPGLAMLRVTVETGEYWDRKQRMIPEFVRLA